jgi:hypothetical protein
VPGSSRGFHFQSQPPDKHTTLMACSSLQPSHEPPHQVQTSVTLTGSVGGGKKNKEKIYKKYELSDNKHPSLEGFPNNACLLFAHAQTLTVADLLSPCACWYARKSLTILTNTLTALFVVNLVKLHLIAF